jgi:sugar phosphate isomerase/epimerase
VRTLAFSSNAFKKNTLAQAINSISEIGYRGVELMADLHHAYPTRFSADARRDTGKRLADLGLIVTNVNAFTHFVDGDTYHPTWIETDAGLLSKRINHTIACIEMAAEFGCKTVSIQPGGPTCTCGLTPDDACDLFADNLGKCVDVARRCGVVLGIEPEPGLLIESAAEYLKFKNHYFENDAAVKMNCDVGHLFCVGDDPAAVIRGLSDHIAHVHLEDIGANRVHQHLTPGKGVIDFSSIFAALDAIDYAGHVTVELYPYETTAAGVARAAWDHLNRVAGESIQR